MSNSEIPASIKVFDVVGKSATLSSDGQKLYYDKADNRSYSNIQNCS